MSLYHWDHTTGSDAIIHSHRTHIIRVLAPSQKVLASHEIGSVVDHEATAFHSDGVTVIKVGMQVSAVTHALMITAAEVPILVKDNLEEKNFISSTITNNIWQIHYSNSYRPFPCLCFELFPM